eukprot:scaffold214251_cov18-Tisochrysis_lutea.AAC.3
MVLYTSPTPRQMQLIFFGEKSSSRWLKNLRWHHDDNIQHGLAIWALFLLIKSVQKPAIAQGWVVFFRGHAGQGSFWVS